MVMFVLGHSGVSRLSQAWWSRDGQLTIVTAPFLLGARFLQFKERLIDGKSKGYFVSTFVKFKKSKFASLRVGQKPGFFFKNPARWV